MGIFDFLKKWILRPKSSTENGVLEPTFLEGKVEHILNPVNLYSHEWRRKLKMKSGQSLFQIKYYGELHLDYQNLIVGTDFAPSKIVAVDLENGNEILLFDGCYHGYDAMFCDSFTNEQIEKRAVDTLYLDQEEYDTFELIISTYNGINYEDEFREDVDSNGQIELITETKLDFEEVKRNGFDTLQIWAVNEKGEKIEIVSEELS